MYYDTTSVVKTSQIFYKRMIWGNDSMVWMSFFLPCIIIPIFWYQLSFTGKCLEFFANKFVHDVTIIIKNGKEEFSLALIPVPT